MTEPDPNLTEIKEEDKEEAENIQTKPSLTQEELQKQKVMGCSIREIEVYNNWVSSEEKI
jgi:hypothetical protein